MGTAAGASMSLERGGGQVQHLALILLRNTAENNELQSFLQLIKTSLKNMKKKNMIFPCFLQLTLHDTLMMTSVLEVGGATVPRHRITGRGCAAQVSVTALRVIS